MYVVDLFCGCGGFSSGAEAAGHKVVLAVDMWEEALATHARNFPDCEHWQMELGEPDFVPRLRQFLRHRGITEYHLHASPPCQNVSRANQLSSKELGKGLELFAWALSTIRELAPYSFSLEQVNSARVTAILDDMGFSYRVVNMSAAGVPNTRKRIIGFNRVDPDLVPPCEAPAVRQVLQRLDMEAPGDRVYTQWRKRGPDGSYFIDVGSMRTLDDVCNTICATAPSFYDTAKRKSTSLPVPLMAHLQGFPPHFVFSGVKKFDRKFIANAVPPLYAQKLMALLPDEAPGPGASFL